MICKIQELKDFTSPRFVGHFGVISLFLFSLFFFPSVTFGLLTTEIFPWALLVSMFYLKKLNYGFIITVSYLVLSAIYTVLISGEVSILGESIRSLASYLNSLFAFALVASLSYMSICKLINLVKVVFFGLIILGIVQYTGLVEPLDVFFKFLVPRASSTALDFMNRGVTLLASEPARAGNELIFLYIVVRILISSKKNKFISDVLLALYLVMIIQSAMALGLYIIYLFIIYRNKWSYFIIPAIIYLIAVPFVNLDSFSGRSADLIREISLLSNFKEIGYLLVNNSGHRLISIYSSFNYGALTLVGGGVGNWMLASVEALEMTGIDLSTYNYFIINGNSEAVAIRSSGFMSNLVLDCGIVGLLIVLSYIIKNIKKYWSVSRESQNIIILFFLKIFFVGSVGHPIAWVSTVLCLRYIKETVDHVKYL